MNLEEDKRVKEEISLREGREVVVGTKAGEGMRLKEEGTARETMDLVKRE